MNTIFTDNEWANLAEQSASNVELEALCRLAEQIDTAKRATHAAARAALAEFDKSHAQAAEHFESCERFQAAAESLQSKWLGVVDLLRKYLPSTTEVV